VALSKEEVRQRQRDRYYAKREQYLERKREYYQENKDTIRKQQAEYRADNYDKVLESNAKWRKNNPVQAQMSCINYRYRKAKAIPSWLTPEDRKAITDIYAQCKQTTEETGVPHHVDHIIPINGEAVSGLHVAWNLQVVPASYNLSKKNKVEAGELTIEPAE
jgi:5-methylcytosine-specific restriction endonuclease McrA